MQNLRDPDKLSALSKTRKLGKLGNLGNFRAFRVFDQSHHRIENTEKFSEVLVEFHFLMPRKKLPCFRFTGGSGRKHGKFFRSMLKGSTLVFVFWIPRKKFPCFRFTGGFGRKHGNFFRSMLKSSTLVVIF